ncbi:hypothetical protein HU200_066532 [Digitaria exilis]|uniref:Uncharacterized protein n=1 Tax=Digitaria exilis TaxID=1010633 RepID=A0A835DTW7_9POAL|nr:hypothetical protein HU200_066532 [Digitaria exilis]
MEVKCRRLEGKVAVVTASTQGIGLAIAERLGPGGRRRRHLLSEADVVLHSRTYAVIRSFGHIDILVSNAAANPTVDDILATKESVLDKLWDINVKASILLSSGCCSIPTQGIICDYYFFNYRLQSRTKDWQCMVLQRLLSLVSRRKKSLLTRPRLTDWVLCKTWLRTAAFLASDDAAFITAEPLLLLEGCSLDCKTWPKFILAWPIICTSTEMPLDPYI